MAVTEASGSVETGTQAKTRCFEVIGVAMKREHPETRMIVVLPGRMADEQSAFKAVGAQVLIRPYAPSELYKALGEAGPAVRESAREAPAPAEQ